MSTWDIGTQTFRLISNRLEYFSAGEWLDVWQIKIFENRKDTSIDVDGVKKTVQLVKREEGVLEGHSRLVTDKDIIFFELENGRSVVLEFCDELKSMIRMVVQRGVKIEKGADIRNAAPWES